MQMEFRVFGKEEREKKREGKDSSLHLAEMQVQEGSHGQRQRGRIDYSLKKKGHGEYCA